LASFSDWQEYSWEREELGEDSSIGERSLREMFLYASSYAGEKKFRKENERVPRLREFRGEAW